MSKKNPVIGGVASIRALKAKIAKQQVDYKAAQNADVLSILTEAPKPEEIHSHESLRGKTEEEIMAITQKPAKYKTEKGERRIVGNLIDTPIDRVTAKNENERARSTCVDPVATVWTLAFDNFDAPRKDVIAMAIAAGVTPGTAKAQYQYWLNAIRGEENFRRVKAKPEIPRCKHGWPLAEYASCNHCATEEHDAKQKPARKPRHSSDSGPAVLAEAFASLKGNAKAFARSRKA